MEAQDDERSGKTEVRCREESLLLSPAEEKGQEVTTNVRASDKCAHAEAMTVGEGAGRVQGLRMEPPDGGWGWVVAFGSAVIWFVFTAMGTCFGVFFSRYLLHAGASSTSIAWIFNCQNFLWNISGLFVRPLSQEFGWRNVGVAGAFLASLGFTITSFTPSPEFLFFSFSILGGIGGGVVCTLCITVVHMYFTRRRGMANAIMMAGSSFGQITVPPFVRLLQDAYSDRGANLLYSGIMLQACLAASTFHPVSRHLKPSPLNFTEQGREIKKPQRSLQATASTKSTKPFLFVRVVKATVSDLGILRSKRACIVCLAWSLSLCSFLNFLMMVPFIVQDAGFSLDFSAWCLSSMAIAGLISRFVSSALSDFSWFRVRVIYVAGFVILTITTAAFPLVASTWWQLTVMVGFGVGAGAVAVLHNLVMIDVMGLNCLAPLVGTGSLISALCLVTLGPLIGVLRDASRSYAVSTWVCAGIVACSVLLWAMMGHATKWDSERRKRSARFCEEREKNGDEDNGDNEEGRMERITK